MESPGHERIVIRSVAQHHELCTAQRIFLFRGLGCLFHDFPHQTYGIHVYACLRTAYVDGTAYSLGPCQSFRDGFYEQSVAHGHSFRNHGRIPSEEIHSYGFGGLVQCHGYLYIVLRSPARRCAHKGYRGDGDSLVHYRNPVFHGYVFSSLRQFSCHPYDFGLYVRAYFIHRIGGTVQQADAHCDGTDIEVFLLDHPVRLDDFVDVDHKPESLYPVHFFENIFALAFYLDADIGPQGLQIRGYLMEVFGDVSGIDYHHHVEIPLDDGLSDVQYVYVLLCQVCAYPGNDADSILADHCDYAPVHV